MERAEQKAPELIWKTTYLKQPNTHHKLKVLQQVLDEVVVRKL